MICDDEDPVPSIPYWPSLHHPRRSERYMKNQILQNIYGHSHWKIEEIRKTRADCEPQTFKSPYLITVNISFIFCILVDHHNGSR